MSRDVFRILMLVLSLAAAPIWADQATVLKPATGAAVTRFKAWLTAQPETKDDEALLRASIYIADLDNDGKPEYIAASFEGSGNYLYPQIYNLQPDGSFRAWTEGASPAEGEGEGDHAYLDPSTRKVVLFTRLGGKTYMSLLGSRGFGSRSSYTWDDKGRHPACDAAWTQYIRAGFKQSYDHKDYELANKALAAFLDQCSSMLDEETRAWINNDLAITQYHLGETRECLEYATRAKTSPKVASAAQYNERLCPQAAKNLSTDFAWLFDASLVSMDKIIWSNRSRFDTLLRAVVPSVDFKGHGDLRDVVSSGLIGPPEAKQVLENRYVTSSACTAHACGFKAMLWVDVKEHLGLAAFFDSAASTDDRGACLLTITSRMVAGPEAIPAAFWPAFAQWRVQEDFPEMARGCVEFIGPEGKTSRVSPR